MLRILRPARFLLALLLSSMPVVGYLHHANYYTFVVSYMIIPVLGWLVGKDLVNEPPRESARRLRNAYYRAILYAYVPIQLALILWGAAVFACGGLAVSVGVVTGAQGISIAHELGHGRSALERLLAQLLLVTVCYGHFYLEHNRGHHARVATPEDPASVRQSESFWAFLPRTLAGSYLHAWSMERSRGRMLAYTLVPFAFAAALSVAFGPLAALFFFVQSTIAVLLLEAVNYVEHYGLRRARRTDGRYERVSERHAWDADQALTNIFLIHLQRHADHHLNPSRPYQTLQHRPLTPKLPAGYAAMVPLALVPPLWFAIMNSRVPKPGAPGAAVAG